MTRNHAAPVLQDVVHMTDDSDDNGQFKTLQKKPGLGQESQPLCSGPRTRYANCSTHEVRCPFWTSIL